MSWIRAARTLTPLLLFVCAVAALVAAARPAPAADGASPVERGAYLTGDAGQCSDCHGAGFVGGPAPGPPGDVPGFAKMAPALRGLPMFANDADAVAFLMSAKLPSGKPALMPMPRYHFNAADAAAIVAYLRSLK